MDLHLLTAQSKTPMDHQQARQLESDLADLLSEDGREATVYCHWISLDDLGLSVMQPTDQDLGVCQLTAEGTEALSALLCQQLRDWADEMYMSMHLHPSGDLTGEARLANHDLVQLQGLACKRFGANVFVAAMQGHPASLQFVRRVMGMMNQDSRALFARLVEEGSQDSARALLEERSGVSFADHLLYYAKGQDGLGNVYSAQELDMLNAAGEPS